MADRRVKIIIDQEGNAQAGMKGILNTFAGFSLAGIAGKAVEGIGSVTGAALEGGKQLLELGSDANEMESAFNIAFGDAAPRARQELDQWGNTVGRSTFDLEKFAGATQSLLVPMGFARDAAAGMSTATTKLAIDLSSFKNVSEEVVAQDINSALIGNTEGMRKYGVVITEATLKAELLTMGIDGTTRKATEQEKVQARLNIIMKQTTDAQGDAERTAGGWANTMRAVQATLSEAATAAGQELIPVLLPLLQNFSDFAKDIMPKVIVIFKEFIGNLKETAGPAMAMIEDAITRIAKAFGVQTDKVSGSDVILKALKVTLDLIITALKAFAIGMQVVADIIERVKRGIDALKSVLDEVKRRWNEFGDAAARAVDRIPDWLVPHSPTKFEIGLRGIAEAQQRVNANMGSMGGGGMTQAAAMPGGPGVTVILQFNKPVLSLFDIQEVAGVLRPAIQEALRG